jgi:hypothetical protein
MLPEEMLGGSKMDGNSIYSCAEIATTWSVAAMYIEMLKFKRLERIVDYI